MNRSFTYKTAGFTFLELVVVIVLVGIIASIGGGLMVRGYQAAYTSIDITDLDWHARLVFERMVREIKNARSATTADITISPATQIVFKNHKGIQVTYALSSGTLTRKEGAGSALGLADNVTSLTFSYRDSNGVVTSTTTDVRYITVAITFTKGDIVRNYQATVFPRNYLI